jgi:hypothetical protein
MAAAARPAPAGPPAATAAPSSKKPPPKAPTTKFSPTQGFGSPACAALDRQLDAQDLSQSLTPGVSATERCGPRCRAETVDALARLYALWQGDRWEVGTPEEREAGALDSVEEAEGDYESAGEGGGALDTAARLRLTNNRPWEPDHDYCSPSDPHSCHVSASAASEGAKTIFTRAQYEANPKQPEYCCWSGVVCCLDYGSADLAAKLAGGGPGSLFPGSGGNSTLLQGPCVPYTVQALVLRGFGANGSLADAMDGPTSPLQVLYRNGLRTLRLSSNDLTGEIPRALADMPLLRTLDLADNWLEGELPPALGALEGLIDLALDFNAFTGPLSSAAFCDPARSGRTRASLATLQALTARANALTGGVDLRACAGLRLVDLRDNRLSGTLPFGVENQALTTIRLGNNEFSGPIPEDVWFVQFLNVLDLNNNSISGSISPAVADAGHLNTLYLGRNKLKGEIPEELFLAPQLSLLELQLNPGLNGSLPRDMTSAVGLTKLWLHGTSVSGPIPSTMAELPFLTDVNIRSTEMSCCRSWDEALRANDTTQARIEAEARGERPDRGRPGQPELLPYFLTFAGDAVVTPGSRVFASTPNAAAPDGTYPGGGVGAAGVRSAAASVWRQQQQQQQAGGGRRRLRELSPLPPSPPPHAPAAPLGASSRSTALAPSPSLHLNPHSHPSLLAATTVKGSFLSNPSVQVDLVLGADTVCPAVRRSPAFATSSAASHSNSRVLTPADLTTQSWQLDPAYYWDMRCRCQAGLKPRRQTFEYTVDGMGAPLRYERLTCVPFNSDDRAVALAVGLSVGLAGAVFCACLFAWCMCFRRVSRTQRAIAAASKRLKGCPRSGTATFVVTDIEGYSDLMKSCPDAMLRALSLHNAVLRRAKYSNVGYTLEQEGDSFALLFHTPYDAVSFCLQAQQALMRVEWPRSLMQALDERMAEETEAALLAAGVPLPDGGGLVAALGGGGGNGSGAGLAAAQHPSPQQHPLTTTTTTTSTSDDRLSSKSAGGGSGWLGEPLESDEATADSRGAAARRRPPSQLWARNQPRVDEDGAAARGRPRGGGGGRADGKPFSPNEDYDDAATDRTGSASTFGGGGLGQPRDLSPAPSTGGGARKPRWLGGNGGGGGSGALAAPARTATGPRAGSTLFSRFASSPSVAWLGGGRGGAFHDRLGGAGASRVLSGGEDGAGAGGLDRKGSGGGGLSGALPPLPIHHHPHAAQANVPSPLLSSVTGPFKGLRVRMGVATGQLPGQGQDPRAAAVFQMAKAVCDAASGGQVLMDARTFAGIKEDLHALGATDAGGLNYRRLASKRSVRDALCCAPPVESDEAVVLDMGAYVVRPWASRLEEQPHRGKPPASGGSAPLASVAEGKPHQQQFSGGAATAAAAADGANQLLPGAMDAQDAAAGDHDAGGGGVGGLGGLVGRQGSLTALGAWTRPNFAQLRGVGGGGVGGGGAGAAGGGARGGADDGGGGGGGPAYPPTGGDPIIGALASQQRLRAEDVVRLVQIIAPPLVGRAKVFGNALSLPAGWVCVDPPYFSAPAAGELPLVPEGRREADVAAIASLDARAAGSGGAVGGGSSSGGGQGSGGATTAGAGGTSSGQDSSGHPQRGSALSVIISGGGAGGAAAAGPVGSIPGLATAAPHGISSNHQLAVAVAAGAGGPSGGARASAPSFFGGPAGPGAAYGARSSLWRSVALGPSGGVFAAVSGAGGARASAATAVIRAQQAAAAGALLSPSLLPLSAPAPPITMVFVCVEGAKALSKRRRAYAREMHALILGLATAALAHVAPPAPPPAYAANGGQGANSDSAAAAHDDETAAARDEAAAAAPRGAGYLCREQEGELKYMVAFSTARAALEWCLVLQEAAMYLRWPRWVLQSKGFHAHHGPAMAVVAAVAAAEAQAQAEMQQLGRNNNDGGGAAAVAAAARLAAEAAGAGSGPLPRLQQSAGHVARSTPTPPSPLPFGAGGAPSAGGARTLLFRGPRLKMGVCEGVPSTVLPDHLGRADYHGSSINQAARYMDAGAHGGQIVCEADLARRVFEEWRREACALGQLAAARAAAATAAAEEGEGGGLLEVGGRRRRGGQEAEETDTDTDAFQEADEASLAGRQQSQELPPEQQEQDARGRAEAAAGPRSHSLRGSPSPARGASRLSNMQRAAGEDEGADGATDAADAAPQGPAAPARTPSPPAPPTTAPPAAVVVPRPDPPGPRLAPPAGATRRPVRVEAHWAGRYRFKGNPAPVDLVSVTPASLAGRLALLPPDPPKGKGVRLHSRCGLAFAAEGAMLPALPQMYRARVPQHVLEGPPGGLRRGGGGTDRSNSSFSSGAGGGGGGGGGGFPPFSAAAAFTAAAGTAAPGVPSVAVAGAASGNPASFAHLRAASMPSSLASGPPRARSRALPSFLMPGRSSEAPPRDASMTLSETAPWGAGSMPTSPDQASPR